MKHLMLFAAALIIAAAPATAASQQHKSLAKPTAQAVLVGFGSGNRAIGDTTGEQIAAWSEGIGLLSGILGAAALAADFMVVSAVKSINEPQYSYEPSGFGKAGQMMILAGGAVMITSRISSAVRVQIWGRMHNRNRQLGISEPGSVTVGFHITENRMKL
jgi:hypothetical protein